jgi:membrane protein implicated in regulation of membrane protease activity
MIILLLLLILAILLRKQIGVLIGVGAIVIFLGYLWSNSWGKDLTQAIIVFLVILPLAYVYDRYEKRKVSKTNPSKNKDLS